MHCYFKFIHLSIAYCIWIPPTYSSNDLRSSCLITDYYAELNTNTDVGWRINTNTLKCLEKCQQLNDENIVLTHSLKKPKFIERIFKYNRNQVNCLKEKRNIDPFCKLKVGEMNLKQYNDLPLLFFPALVRMSRFEAERFCSRWGLIFGLPQPSMAKFFQLASAENIMFWDQSLTYKNVSMTENRAFCVSVVKNKEVITSSLAYCKEEYNFVCSLPDVCHNESCKCTAGDCKPAQDFSSMKKIDDCEPGCESSKSYASCGLQPLVVWGIKPAGGDRIVFGNKQYFVSKSMVESVWFHKNSHVFGITILAFVQGGAHHVLHERYAFGEYQLAKGKRTHWDQFSQSLLATEFWTSGWSGNCSTSFAWCAHDELVDFGYLNVAQPQTKNPNNCLLMTVDETKGTNITSISLKGADCMQKKRPICQAPSPQICRDLVCLKVECPDETKTTNRVRKDGSIMIDKVVAFLMNCSKEIFVHTKTDSGHVKSYFEALKWACSLNHTMITLDTNEKRECVGKAMAAIKVLPGKYSVSATSLNCPNVIKWCNLIDNPLANANQLPWKIGEPTRTMDKECIVADFKTTPPYFTFEKVNCLTPHRMLTESIVNYNTPN